MCMVAQSFVLVYIWHATVLLIFVATAACKFVLQISAPVDHNFVLHLWLATVCCKALPLCSSALQLVLRRAFLPSAWTADWNELTASYHEIIHPSTSLSLSAYLIVSRYIFPRLCQFSVSKSLRNKTGLYPVICLPCPLTDNYGPGPRLRVHYGPTGLRAGPTGPGPWLTIRALRAHGLTGLMGPRAGPTGLRARTWGFPGVNGRVYIYIYHITISLVGGYGFYGISPTMYW